MLLVFRDPLYSQLVAAVVVFDDIGPHYKNNYNQKLKQDKNQEILNWFRIRPNFPYETIIPRGITRKKLPFYIRNKLEGGVFLKNLKCFDAL